MLHPALNIEPICASQQLIAELLTRRGSNLHTGQITTRRRYGKNFKAVSVVLDYARKEFLDLRQKFCRILKFILCKKRRILGHWSLTWRSAGNTCRCAHNH